MDFVQQNAYLNMKIEWMTIKMKQEWVPSSEEERKELERVYKKEQKWIDSGDEE